MEIRNLITFIRVSELGSFTKAAKELDYSQSTVSFQIKQLEDELGCLLFERINHTITLTERGKDLLEYAHSINRMTEEFQRKIAPKYSLNGYIHILAPDSVCEEMMLSNYEGFHKKYPNISLKFTSADTVDMFRMLDHNEADVMITLDEHIYQRDYVIEKEAPVDMHFVVGADSPLAKCKALTLADIAKEPFILTEKSIGYRRALDKALAKRSLEITPALEIGRTDIITSILEKGNFISFMPDFVTRSGVASGKLAYLNITDVKFDIWKQLLYHKNKWLSESMRALLDYIKENEFDKKH